MTNTNVHSRVGTITNNEKVKSIEGPSKDYAHIAYIIGYIVYISILYTAGNL